MTAQVDPPTSPSPTPPTPTPAGRPDGELLSAYTHCVREADAAFTQLVARYGAMVYQTCLRMIGDASAAEDAAQATFLVLARKAPSVRGPVGGYLHGVAYLTARQMLDADRLRKRREHEAGRMHQQRQADAQIPSALLAEVEPYLDEEIEALPTQQRRAVVLQYLEGLTQDQIAERLGVARVTVARHVQLGLEKLRSKLTHRGIGLSEPALNESLANTASERTCPAFLLASAGKLAGAGMLNSTRAAASSAIPSAVTHLYKGTMQMMYWAKVKVAASVAAAVLIVSVAGSFSMHQLAAGEGPAQGPVQAETPPLPPKPSQTGPGNAAEQSVPAPAVDLLKTAKLVRTTIPFKSNLGALIERRGTAGVLVIRSEQRFQSFIGDLHDNSLRGIVELPLNDLAKTDYTKNMVLLLINSATQADTLDLTSLTGNAQAIQAEVKITTHAALQNTRSISLVAVSVPMAQSVRTTFPVKVTQTVKAADGTVSTETKTVERTWTIDAKGGDVIDGLQSVLHLDSAIEHNTIAPGDDLKVVIELKIADLAQKESAWVWDNTYSEGYRNDGYVVVNPDGTAQILRRPANLEWDKNAPRPVEVKPVGAAQDKSPLGGELVRKSLKELGFDTSHPGTYTLYGFYEEAGAAAPKWAAGWPGIPPSTSLWGGMITTPPIQFTIAAKAATPTPAADVDEPLTNATSKWLGTADDWATCSVKANDVHPLWGGMELTLKGDGTCKLRRVRQQKETVREFKLAAGESVRIRKLLIANDLVTLKIPEHKGAPDDGRPDITLTNAKGEVFKISKWASDAIPAFDTVYQALAAIGDKAEENK